MPVGFAGPGDFRLEQLTLAPLESHPWSRMSTAQDPLFLCAQLDLDLTSAVSQKMEHDLNQKHVKVFSKYLFWVWVMSNFLGDDHGYFLDAHGI